MITSWYTIGYFYKRLRIDLFFPKDRILLYTGDFFDSPLYQFFQNTYRYPVHECFFHTGSVFAFCIIGHEGKGLYMDFTFGLQKIRDFTAVKEEQAKIQYARLQQELNLHTNVIRSLEHSILKESEQLYEEKNPSANMLWLKERYIQSLQEDLAVALRKKEELERMQQEQHKTLLSFAQKTKILDTLKERQQLSFLENEKRKEEQSRDEMTVMRFNSEYK